MFSLLLIWWSCWAQDYLAINSVQISDVAWWRDMDWRCWPGIMAVSLHDDVMAWNDFCITGPLWGDSPHKEPVMQSFVFFVVNMKELLSTGLYGNKFSANIRCGLVTGHGLKVLARDNGCVFTWRCYDVEMLFALLALCEWNPLVIGWLSPQKASNAEILCFLEDNGCAFAWHYDM